MSISFKNYNKPTPRWLKLIADTLLFITMFADFMMATKWLENMPNFEHKEWIVWIISGAVLLFKFFTKLISDITEPTPPQS